MATLTGLIIGAALAVVFWVATLFKLDRWNQGLLGSGGLAALIALCLVYDGWILVAILGFVAVMVGLIQLQTSLPAFSRRS